MKNIRVCISVLLSAVMLVTVTLLPNRVTATDMQSDNNTEIKEEYVTVKEQNSLITNETELVAAEDLHMMISREDVENYGHIGRAEEYESSLNSLVMRNSDGTLTTYIFSEDIKYVDESGNIKDKETSLTNATDEKFTAKYAFATQSNDVQLLFPRSLGKENGVLLDKDDINIELKPIPSDMSVSRAVQVAYLIGSEKNV